MGRTRTWCLVLVVLSLPMMACAITGQVGQQVQQKAGQVQATVGAEAATEAATVAEVVPTPANVRALTSTPPPTQPAAAEEVEGLDALDSYRSRQTIKVQNDDGSKSYEMTIDTEWVREPPAKRVAMSDTQGTLSWEIVTIGDTTWMKTGDSWMQSQADEGTDLSSDLDSFLTGSDGDVKLVGGATVNGVRCKHYTFDQQTTVPSAQGGTVTVRVQGERWVADQSGLPPVIIRERAQLEGTLGLLPLPGVQTSDADEFTSSSWEREVSDINAPITIEPPVSADDIGAATGVPMMADAQVTLASSGMTMYTTAGSVDDVVAFYESELPAAGWTQEGETDRAESIAMMQFGKDDQSLSLQAMPSQGGAGTQVILSVQ